MPHLYLVGLLDDCMFLTSNLHTIDKSANLGVVVMDRERCPLVYVATIALVDRFHLDYQVLPRNCLVRYGKLASFGESAADSVEMSAI